MLVRRGGSIAVDASGVTIGVTPIGNVLNSNTYGQAVQFGNVHGSFGGAGTGAPAESYMPVVIYEALGTAGGPAVTKTTQALRAIIVYRAPTADDSAEAVSSQVILGDSAASSFTQSLITTGHEGSAQVRGSVHATGLVVGAAGRIIASETSTIDAAIAVYASLTKDAGATVTAITAFGDNGQNGFTWGVNVKADIFTAGSLWAQGFVSNNALYADEPLAAAVGEKTWSYDPSLAGTATAPTAGTVYATAVAYRQGQVVNRLDFYVAVAGAGTAPTHIYAGICDSTGRMLAQIADAAGSAQWTSSANRIASVDLTGPWTVPTSGLYYHVFLQVGAWGTTQLTLNRVGGVAAMNTGTLLYATGGTTGQAALPANNSTITGGLVATNALRYWTGGR